VQANTAGTPVGPRHKSPQPRAGLAYAHFAASLAEAQESIQLAQLATELLAPRLETLLRPLLSGRLHRLRWGLGSPLAWR